MTKKDIRWAMTAGGVWRPYRPVEQPSQPTASDADRPRFKNIGTYLCASEVAGRPISPDALRQLVGTFGKIPLFTALATLAAVLANQGVMSNAARWLTIEPLIHGGKGVDPRSHAVADWLSENKHRVIAHEHVVLWLQAVALIEGNDSDRHPTLDGLAWLLALANDHLGIENVQTPPGLTSTEDLLVKTAFYSRFNKGGEPAADFVRSYDMMRLRPDSGPLAAESTWQRIQSAAFHGMTFEEYFETVLGPLVIMSNGWGKKDEHGKIVPPRIDPQQWKEEYRTPPPELVEIFRQLSIPIDDAVQRLKADVLTNGLPGLPLIFAMHPFLRLETGELIAASVWFLRDQIRLGVWSRYRNATGKICGGKAWLPAFGKIFEKWAQQIAKAAGESSDSYPEVRVPEISGGVDELEDVVLVERNRIALVSVKARLMPGDSLCNLEKLHNLIAWYSSVLFAEKTSDYHEGALPLLNQRVNRIREGRVNGVDPDARIYPVLLTFEKLGDTAVLYKWVQEECRARNLLCQNNVAPITFLSADHYEQILAAARKLNFFDILDRRGTTDEGLVPIDVVLQELGPELRIPYVDRQFQIITRNIFRRIFGREMEAP